jgi:hypothetical protein
VSDRRRHFDLSVISFSLLFDYLFEVQNRNALSLCHTNLIYRSLRVLDISFCNIGVLYWFLLFLIYFVVISPSLPSFHQHFRLFCSALSHSCVSILKLSEKNLGDENVSEEKERSKQKSGRLWKTYLLLFQWSHLLASLEYNQRLERLEFIHTNPFGKLLTKREGKYRHSDTRGR